MSIFPNHRRGWTVISLTMTLILAVALSGCSLWKGTKTEVKEIKEQLSAENLKKTVEKAKTELKEKVKETVKKTVKEDLDPQKVFSSKALNFVFFGLDRTEERESTIGSFRTDTINIMRLDFVNHKVFMFSIPRDTYVYIPNRDTYNRINAAFPFGGGLEGEGFQNSIRTIENFIDVKIDHYFGMDMEAIAPIVDAVGGVEYDVDVAIPGSGIEKGLQVLDGKAAEQYVRFRHTSMGDIDRIARQQKFMIAFFKTAKSRLTIDKGLQILEAVKKMTYTDLGIRQMSSLAFFFSTLNEGSFDGYIAEGSFMNKDGRSYWKPNMDKINAKVSEIFGEAE